MKKLVALGLAVPAVVVTGILVQPFLVSRYLKLARRPPSSR